MIQSPASLNAPPPPPPPWNPSMMADSQLAETADYKPSELFRDAWDAADGNPARARDIAATWVVAEMPEGVSDLAVRLIEMAVREGIAQEGHARRSEMMVAARQLQRMQSERGAAQDAERLRLYERAKCVFDVWLLPDGSKLGDATRPQVVAARESIRAQITGLQEHERFYLRIESLLPDDTSTVASCLTIEQVQAIAAEEVSR